MPLPVQALWLGLSTGIFCLGFCYPALAPVLLSRNRESPAGTAASVGLFLLGRLAAYLLVGFAVGFAGERVRGAAGSVVVSGALALLGLLLALYAVLDRLPRWEICRVAARGMGGRSFLLPLGFLTGVSPCPPFLLAVTAAIGTGSPLQGALFFLCFYAGTSVYLLPFAASWLPARSQTLRRAARIAAIVAAAWYVWLGVHGLAARI